MVNYDVFRSTQSPVLCKMRNELRATSYELRGDDLSVAD